MMSDYLCGSGQPALGDRILTEVRSKFRERDVEIFHIECIYLLMEIRKSSIEGLKLTFKNSHIGEEISNSRESIRFYVVEAKGGE